MKYLLFFVMLTMVLEAKCQKSITIGAILNQNGTAVASTNPSRTAINLALNYAPLNRRNYFIDGSKHWICQDAELKAFKDGEVKWKYKIHVADSKQQSLPGQINEIFANNESVVSLIGFLNSNMVGEVYSTSGYDIPIVSSIATASKFTIRSQQHLEADKWNKAHKWFFRSTSPDILRVEALQIGRAHV